jgi:hypothetical protein
VNVTPAEASPKPPAVGRPAAGWSSDREGLTLNGRLRARCQALLDKGSKAEAAYLKAITQLA